MTVLDAAGRDAPTCRECGGLCVTRDGRVTCSACGYVAGTMLAELRALVEHGDESGRQPYLRPPHLMLALAEARDEGHAAGRAEALEALDRMRSTVTSWLAALAGMDRVPCRHYRECGCREVLDRERVMRMIVDLRDAPGFRALAGKQ